MMENLNDIQFVAKPCKDDLQVIKAWCEPYNYEDAENAFKNKKLFVIHYQNRAIGFLCYRRNKIIATIDFAEVQHDFRNQGVGGYMLDSALRYFKCTRIKCAELYCTSEGSHRHAARHGFIPVKKAMDNLDWMYCPLEPIRHPCNNSKRMFVIWKNLVGSYSNRPDICWALDDDTKNPIIAYCHYDWVVGIIENGKIIKHDKFKYYFKDVTFDYVYLK